MIHSARYLIIKQRKSILKILKFYFLKPTFQSTGVPTLYFCVSWRDSITLIISLQFKVWNFSGFTQAIRDILRNVTILTQNCGQWWLGIKLTIASS